MWTTEAILLEVSAGFADPRSRVYAARIWEEVRGGDPRFQIALASTVSLDEAMDLYRARPDKAWSLADCLSFLVMGKEGLSAALTTDHHFQQAGFHALLLE